MKGQGEFLYECSDCGAKVMKDDVICPNCGANLEEEIDDEEEEYEYGCSECGVVVNPDDKVCHNCGAALRPELSDESDLEYTCSECGTVVKYDDKVCPSCGTNLEAESENELVQIPVNLDFIDINFLESVLQDNDIEYSINTSSLNSVFGISQPIFLLVDKSQSERVKQIIKRYETDIKTPKQKEESKGPVGVGGFLLIFCVLIVLKVLYTLPDLYIYFSMGLNFGRYPFLSLLLNTYVIIEGLLSLYGLYVVGVLWKIKRNAIASVNIYLNLNILLNIIFLISFTITLDMYEIEVYDLIMEFGELIQFTFISIFYLFAWKLYFKNSKRVKKTYKN